jgi:hypothetical protein
MNVPGYGWGEGGSGALAADPWYPALFAWSQPSLPRRPERWIWSPERVNGANAGTYPSTTGGMTSGRTMLRDFKRSSTGAMSCFLPRLRHDDKESVYVLRRIEEMWSDANFTLTQGNHEPLVSQRLI